MEKLKSVSTTSEEPEVEMSKYDAQENSEGVS